MQDIFEIKHAFQPVGGLSSTQTMKMMKVEAAMREAAEQVLDLVPAGSDRTYVMRKLLECKFWCVQAITHEQAPKKSPGSVNPTAAKSAAPAPITPPPSEPVQSGGQSPSENGGPQNG